MSHLKYSAYEGVGANNLKTYHYNQAVRIPAGADRVELAGQGMAIYHRYHESHTRLVLTAARRLGPSDKRGQVRLT